jgi:AcrR family transcriptional regulator
MPRRPAEKKSARPKVPRTRLSVEARRKQLIELASTVLSDRGATGLEIKEIAGIAGITRPVIYRIFPTRQALVLAVLEDFEQALSVRFRDALVESLGKPLHEVTNTFVDAVCDTIEAKGSGPWNLFDARTTDLEAARLGKAVQEKLISPWIERIAQTTGREPQEVGTVIRIVVAAGRAALDGWLEGRVSREAARADAARAVSALLAAFASRAS